jgi:hypothetical protein
MIHTQTDAKKFFVEKVLTEAKREGVTLSKAEQRMLSWSESDPDFTAESALIEQLANEISEEDYESKVSTLLAGAYRRDLESNPLARDEYRQAHSVLSRGDHYILVMIERTLGRRLRPWWKFSLT